MAEKLTRFDPAEGLTSQEAIAVFVTEAFASQDADYIAHAFGVVARAEYLMRLEQETDPR